MSKSQFGRTENPGIENTPNFLKNDNNGSNERPLRLQTDFRATTPRKPDRTLGSFSSHGLLAETKNAMQTPCLYSMITPNSGIYRSRILSYTMMDASLNALRLATERIVLLRWNGNGQMLLAVPRDANYWRHL